MKNPTSEIVLAGGGTAGHVEPALAVAEALVASGHRREALRFVGTRRGVEARLVRPEGFVLTELPGRGIERRPNLRNLSALAGLAGALVAAAVLVRRWRPRVVVAVGGYGSVACALAGWIWRVPVVVVNVDAVPGAANRLNARVAKVCAAAADGSGLPRAVVTGAPVRVSVLDAARAAADRAQAKRTIGADPERSVLVVVGGSLGANRLNVLALALAQRLSSRDDLELYHVSGEREYAQCARRAQSAHLDAVPLRYRIVAYEQRLPQVLAAADLAISRAGASTVAEMAVIGTPTIFVPLPGAPGDHQAKNAAALANAGAAVVVDDAQATIEQLWDEVTELLKDEHRRDEMRERAKGVARPEAAQRVAELVEKVASPPPGSGRAAS